MMASDALDLAVVAVHWLSVGVGVGWGAPVRQTLGGG